MTFSGLQMGNPRPYRSQMSSQGGCYPLGISTQIAEAFRAELLNEGLSIQLSAYVLTGTEDYMEPRKLHRRLKQYTQDCV